MIKPTSSLIYKSENISMQESKANEATTLIQKYVRGYLARKGYLLSPSYSNYKQSILKTTLPEHGIPMAASGKTKVYLPLERPEIILKASGRKDAITRFHQMQKVRSVLDSQKSSHLTVPKAALCENFLVEKRIPIDTNRFYNMGLYIEDPSLFDEAICEMTRLFSRIQLTDLISSQYHPSNNIVGNTVRYDNLPLYTETHKGKRIGKIALIDLEHVSDKPNHEGYYGGMASLARIFPYHLNLIIEEASKLNIPIDPEILERRAAEGRKYLLEGYITHLNWLSEKNITSENATELFEVDASQMNVLINRIKEELVKINNGQNDISYKKYGSNEHTCRFLNENPEQEAQDLAMIIAPLLIDNLKKAIGKEQTLESKTTPGETLPEAKIVSLRSPIFERKEIYRSLFPLIKRPLESLCDQRNDIADQLLFIVLEELVKGRQLFSFDHGFNTGGHEFGWLRY